MLNLVLFWSMQLLPRHHGRFLKVCCQINVGSSCDAGCGQTLLTAIQDAAAYVGASIGERKRLTAKCGAKACFSPPRAAPRSDRRRFPMHSHYSLQARLPRSHVLTSPRCTQPSEYSLQPFVNVSHRLIFPYQKLNQL